MAAPRVAPARALLYGPDGAPLAPSRPAVVEPPPAPAAEAAPAPAAVEEPVARRPRSRYDVDYARTPENPEAARIAVARWPGLRFAFLKGKRVYRRDKATGKLSDRYVPLNFWMVGERHRPGYAPRGVLVDAADTPWGEATDFFFIVCDKTPTGWTYRVLDRRILAGLEAMLASENEVAARNQARHEKQVRSAHAEMVDRVRDRKKALRSAAFEAGTATTLKEEAFRARDLNEKRAGAALERRAAAVPIE